MPQGPLIPACEVEWDEQGGRVLVTGSGISDAEREYIAAHFRLPATTNSGGQDPKLGLYDKHETLQPGTLGHYRAAVHTLRGPFMVMGKV